MMSSKHLPRTKRGLFSESRVQLVGIAVALTGGLSTALSGAMIENSRIWVRGNS